MPFIRNELPHLLGMPFTYRGHVELKPGQTLEITENEAGELAVLHAKSKSWISVSNKALKETLVEPKELDMETKKPEGFTDLKEAQDALEAEVKAAATEQAEDAPAVVDGEEKPRATRTKKA